MLAALEHRWLVSTVASALAGARLAGSAGCVEHGIQGNIKRGYFLGMMFKYGMKKFLEICELFQYGLHLK
jgi:hypothetical protein